MLLLHGLVVKHNAPVAQRQSSRMVSERPVVRLHPGAPPLNVSVAQRTERVPAKDEVGGLNPPGDSIEKGSCDA